MVVITAGPPMWMLRVYTWLSLVDLKLEVGQKLESCQLLSPSYLGPIVAEVINELTVSLVEMAVWLPTCLTDSGLASWAGYCRQGVGFLDRLLRLWIRVLFLYVIWLLFIVYSVSLEEREESKRGDWEGTARGRRKSEKEYHPQSHENKTSQDGAGG